MRTTTMRVHSRSCLLGALLCLPMALAASPGEVRLIIPETPESGSNFAVEVHIEAGFNDLAAFQLTVEFDEWSMALVSGIGMKGVEPGDPPWGDHMYVNDTVPGEVRWSMYHTSMIPTFGDNHVATIHFHLSPTCNTSVIGGIVEVVSNSSLDPIGAPTPRPILGANVPCSGLLDGAMFVDGPALVLPGDPVTFDVFVQAGAQVMRSYEVQFVFDPAQIQLDTGRGMGGVSPGTSPLGLPFRFTPSGPDLLVILDDAPTASGPAYMGLQHLCSIHFLTRPATTAASLQGTLFDLRNSMGAVIGAPVPRALPPSIIPVHLVCGDADWSAAVTILDSLVTAQHAVGLITLVGPPLVAADLDGNGVADILDALQISKLTIGLPIMFACP